MDSNKFESIAPAQKRKRRPRRRESGVYYFRKDTLIEYGSTLERDFLIRKEFSLAVLDVIPQPCEIPYFGADGQPGIYIPPFLVYYRLGDMSYEDYPKPVLVDVKSERDWRTKWREWLPKWKAAYRHADEQGWVFHIHDESRIRDQAFENIMFLDRYKRMEFPVEETRWIIDNIRQMGSAPFHYILARHFFVGMYRPEGISHIWHLLATRQLDCDISRPLNDFTELWLPIDPYERRPEC